MGKVITLAEQFFWTMVWVFIILIAGFFILGYVKDKFDGNIIGNFAGWVSNHAEPQ